MPIIFITGKGSSDTAIEAMKCGAYDYLLKPLDVVTLRDVVIRALEIRGLMQNARDEGDHWSAIQHDGLIGNSPQMQDVFKSIGTWPLQDVTVLIHGESGTGKELVARAFFSTAVGLASTSWQSTVPHSGNAAGKRAVRPREGGLHHAEQRRIGKFEQCSGGTIFLDEVGDMSPLVQSKVLRVLQEQRFERVGGGETIQTNVPLSPPRIAT